MDNLSIYNVTRAVPREALKEIQAGRLKGKSDINPMWRIKALTEQFGPCGIGWYYTIEKQWLENGANNEIAAFVNISLYIKVEGEWSAPIPGTGGSSFVAQERNGLYTSDECYKMALTDAISVACKALGFAADVYWNSDRTKYSQPEQPAQKPQAPRPQPAPTIPAREYVINEAQAKRMFAIAKQKGVPSDELKDKLAEYGFASSKDLTKSAYDKICAWAENYVELDTDFALLPDCSDQLL